MDYSKMEKVQLIEEIETLQERIAGLERAEAQRKRANEALRESEQRLSTIFAASPDCIYLSDTEGRVLDANPTLLELVGLSLEQMQERNVLDFFAGDNPGELLQAASRLQAGEEVRGLEAKAKLATGEMRDYEMHAIPLKEKRVVTAILSVARDITERKRAEEERERLLAELEAKNRELNSFVYTVSHDLKAPLVSLDGFSSMLQKECYDQLGEQGQHYLDRLQANVSHMDDLIMHLLELSRIGRVVGPTVEIDVAALVREVQEDLAVKLEEVEAELVVQEPLPTIRADRTRIRQVFTNLIDNAVKFRSEERPLRIEVGCQEEGGFHRFHVSDNGIGIVSQYQEQVFKPFQQLEAETEGVGMGLALVKKIVEHHGGRVWVESELGQGAAFCFTLPRSR
jgi:two-component system sensor kinase FixL